MTQEMEECRDCRGTGRESPDCEICGGLGALTEKEILEKGYSVEDFELLHGEDDYYECFECHDVSCSMCWGDGRVKEGTYKNERLRVLLTAMSKWNEVFPKIAPSPSGRLFLDHSAYLSKAAAGDLVEEGKVCWFASVFGDELSLVRDDELELMSCFDDGTSRFLSDAKCS